MARRRRVLRDARGLGDVYKRQDLPFFSAVVAEALVAALAEDPGVDAAVLVDASAAQAASRLAAATAPGVRCVALESGPSMLIRPDACVAWIGADDGVDGLEDALRRWFGPAR